MIGTVTLSPDAFSWVPRCSLGGCPVRRVEHSPSVSRRETIFRISCHGQTREIPITVEALYLFLSGVDAAELVAHLIRDPFPLPRLPPRLNPPQVRARGRALPAIEPGRFIVWEMPPMEVTP